MSDESKAPEAPDTQKPTLRKLVMEKLGTRLLQETGHADPERVLTLLKCLQRADRLRY